MTLFTTWMIPCVLPWACLLFLENGCGAEGQGLFLANVLEGWRESGQLLSSCVYNVRLWNFSHSRLRENSCSILLHIRHKCAGHGYMSQGHVHTVPLGSETFWLLSIPRAHAWTAFHSALHSFILLNFWKQPFLLFYMYKNLNMNNSPLGSSLLLNCGKQMWQNS